MKEIAVALGFSASGLAASVKPAILQTVHVSGWRGLVRETLPFTESGFGRLIRWVCWT